jgi:hypothetical protein
MIKQISIIIFLVLSAEAYAESIRGDGYYGEWWTDTSALMTTRQRLVIESNVMARWVLIDDTGLEKSYVIKPPNISFIDDLVLITVDLDEKQRFKAVLGGWKLDSGYATIFGALFLYSQYGKNLELYNGSQIKFRRGEEPLDPQPVWELFNSPLQGPFTKNDFNNLRTSLTESSYKKQEIENGVQAYVGPGLKSILLTVESHPAHPAAIGVAATTGEKSRIFLFGRFAGSETKFYEWYREHEQAVEEAQKSLEN